MRPAQYCVLVAGADASLGRAVTERLHGDGMTLVVHDNAAEIVERGAQGSDLVLMRFHGYATIDAIRRFRAVTTTPLIALVDAATDHVEAIEAGADDSLRMPCPPREIAAKVRSAARRRSWSPLGATLDFGALVIDRAAHEVRMRDRSSEWQVVALPRREYELLVFLARQPSRVFSRTELLTSVWEASADWLGLATVTEHVRRLRGRLAAAGSDHAWIRTVRSTGYRFDPPARES